MRETSKPITLNEESYRLRKLDVFSGSYLLKFLLEKCLPVLQVAMQLFSDEDQSKQQDDSQLMSAATKVIPELLSTVSEDDLKQIIVKCLNNVDKSLEAGYQPVMFGMEFGIEGMEYDMVTCLILCWQEIVFNCQGFFGEGGWDFKKLMKGITLPHTPSTSTSARSPR